MSDLGFSVLKTFFHTFYQHGLLTKSDWVIHLSELILWLRLSFKIKSKHFAMIYKAFLGPYPRLQSHMSFSRKVLVTLLVPCLLPSFLNALSHSKVHFLISIHGMLTHTHTPLVVVAGCSSQVSA